MSAPQRVGSDQAVDSPLAVCGAHIVAGPDERRRADIFIAGKRIHRIAPPPAQIPSVGSDCQQIDLHDLLLLPGLVNAHDHLQFALHPRLGDRLYRNYIGWGEDIHARFPGLIGKYKTIPRQVRIWWGVIRNLLCGVTTVCHHDALWPEFPWEDLPIRVLRNYGWAHSVALGGDLLRLRTKTPAEWPFILHACEGVGEQMRRELAAIDALGLLDESTVLVHGLAMQEEDVARLQERGASLILCPSSNAFLFGCVPQFADFESLENLALGSDSSLTAKGDLLDEIQFSIACAGVPAARAFDMVTAAPARILRLENGEGSIREGHVADFVAVKDTGVPIAGRLECLSAQAVEMVMTGGEINLASQEVLERMPPAAREGLEPIDVDGVIRWVRAPIRSLMRAAEEVLGAGNLRFGLRPIRIPEACQVCDVC